MNNESKPIIDFLLKMEDISLAIITGESEESPVFINSNFQELFKIKKNSINFKEYISKFFQDELSQYISSKEYNLPIEFKINDYFIVHKVHIVDDVTYVISKNKSKEKEISHSLKDTSDRLNFILEKNNMGIFNYNTITKEFSVDSNWKILNNIGPFLSIDYEYVQNNIICDYSNKNILTEQIIEFLNNSSESEHIVFRYRIKDKWLRTKLYKDIDLNTDHIKIIGLCSDVTTQVNNEQKLKEKNK